MEDAASEMSDWEVLSATSACGGGDDDEVLIVSGGGGDVVLDHFAITADPVAACPGDGEGSWSGPGGALELVDGFVPIPESSFNPAAGVLSQQPPIGGVDNAREESLILQATLARGAGRSADGNQAEEVVDAEIEPDCNSVISRGELCPVLHPAHHGVLGETLDSATPTATGASLQSEVSESSLVQLHDGGIGAGVDSSCLEDAVSSDGIHGEQEEQEQWSNANAATGCDEPDGGAKDAALPLAHTPEEGEKQFVVWWRLPFKLLHYCAWKVKPVWSFSIAVAFLGLVVLGRRMYRIKRKARGLPQIKIAFDDKRASQFADRAARLNEAFLVARRVPMLRTSSGATLPWSMVQDR